MNRSPIWSLLMRVLTVVACVVLVGIVFTLLGKITSILPHQMQAAIGAGWNEVWTFISPGVAPVAGVAIVCAVVYVVGRGR
jgi:hypothetical protein